MILWANCLGLFLFTILVFAFGDFLFVCVAFMCFTVYCLRCSLVLGSYWLLVWLVFALFVALDWCSYGCCVGLLI